MSRHLIRDSEFAESSSLYMASLKNHQPPSRVEHASTMAIDMDASTQTNSDRPGMPPSPDDVIDKLRDLVSTNHLNQDISAMHIRAMALMGRLKSLNRAANTATRLHKDATTEARQDMDQSHLGLQNLLYEKRHLEREIEKCRQFA